MDAQATGQDGVPAQLVPRETPVAHNVTCGPRGDTKRARGEVIPHAYRQWLSGDGFLGEESGIPCLSCGEAKLELAVTKIEGIYQDYESLAGTPVGGSLILIPLLYSV